MTSEQARELALALPEAVERDHHGMPSFRVRGKIWRRKAPLRLVREHDAEAS